MIIRYQFFEDEKLLIIRYEGVFSIDQFKKAAIEMQKKNSFKNLKSLFIDLRDIITGKNFLVFNELIKVRNASHFKGYKVAYLVEDPKILVNIHLYKDHINSADYQYFSTLEPCINHLEISISNEEIEKRINELKNTIS